MIFNLFNMYMSDEISITSLTFSSFSKMLYVLFLHQKYLSDIAFAFFQSFFKNFELCYLFCVAKIRCSYLVFVVSQGSSLVPPSIDADLQHLDYFCFCQSRSDSTFTSIICHSDHDAFEFHD